MTSVPPFFVSPPEIVTERLVLRPLRAEDAEGVYSYGSREIVTKYVLFPTHKSIADTEEFLGKLLSQTSLEIGVVWGIRALGNERLLGTIGLHKIELAHDTLEVGYALHDDFWGKGYTTEALKAVIDAVFHNTSINRIEAVHVAEHGASGRVMEKAGMKYEGTLRESRVMKPGTCDMKIYSILRSEHGTAGSH